MKRGFLNDKSKERDGLGALQDPRSQEIFLFRDRVGGSSKGWGSSSSGGWGSGSATKYSSSWGTTNKQTGPWVRKLKRQDGQTHEPDEAESSAKNAMVDLKDATAHSDSSTQDALQHLADIGTGTTQSMFATNPIFSAGGLALKERQGLPNATLGHFSTNPFIGQPLLPNLTMGVPKAALQGWYGQRPERFQVSKDQYVSWNDGGRPHELKFVCLFVCPLTGEVFSSGRYGSNSDLFVTRADEATGADVIWYKKKTNAEHGAAARAYDCYSYRQYFGSSTRSVRLGQDAPYLEASEIHRDISNTNVPVTLPSIPVELEVKVQQLQQQALERAKVNEWNAGVDLQIAEQEQGAAKVESMETEEYRRVRKRPVSPVAELVVTLEATAGSDT